MPPESPQPKVSVIVPTLNEERHIEDCVASIQATRYPRDRFEVLVVDGGSTDRTVALAHGLAQRFGNVRVLDNPGRIQSRALNLGIAASDPESSLIIRADAHSVFPDDFVALCVDAMEQSRADVVVFVAVPTAQGGCFQKAVACAQSTPLGVGNSAYRLDSTVTSRPVDHGFHGCFRRDMFARSGPYDETFTHNEDGELSYRIVQAGGRIFLDQRIRVSYVPRRTPGALVRQYRLYGRGRARNQLKHGMRPRLRQIAPVGLIAFEAVLALLGGLALVGGVPAAPVLAGLGLLGVYLFAMMTAGVFEAVARRDPCLLLLPLALGIMHHAWGFGFAEQLAAGPGLIGAANLPRTQPISDKP